MERHRHKMNLWLEDDDDLLVSYKKKNIKKLSKYKLGKHVFVICMLHCPADDHGQGHK